MILTNRSRVTTEVSAANEPITKAEAKLWVKRETNETLEDDLLEGLIASARLECEKSTGLIVPRQTVEDYMSAWPIYDPKTNPYSAFQLLRYPVSAVTSVKYYDKDGVERTLAATVYAVNYSDTFAQISLLPSKTWPDTDGRALGITVEYEAGWATPALVPQDLKTAIKFKLCAAYEKRSDSVRRYENASDAILKKRYVHLV